MDDSHTPHEATGLPAPHLRYPAPPESVAADFVPLRLLLQPGGLCIEMTKPDTLLGRHSEADVRLSLPDVSRRHCRFVFKDEAWQVIDLNSLNGVHVNGARLEESVLCQGDHVRIGSLTFLVDLGPAPRGVPLPAAEDDARASVLQSIADVLPGRADDKRKSA